VRQASTDSMGREVIHFTALVWVYELRVCARTAHTMVSAVSVPQRAASASRSPSWLSGSGWTRASALSSPGGSGEVERGGGERLRPAPHRQPEAAAGQWSPHIERTGAGCGIESRAQYVGEGVEELYAPAVVLRQVRLTGFARELRRHLGPLAKRAVADRERGRGVVPAQEDESSGQPGGVERCHVERSDAARRAPEP
jgi:hypothetical protein